MQQTFEHAVRGHAVDAARRILQAGFPLIGKVDVTVRSKEQVVESLETFRRPPLQQRSNLPGRWLQGHQSVLVIGDENATVLMDFEPVWLAVIFGRDFKLTR